MPILTFVARVSDGMILVASMENAGDGTENLDVYKQQGKQIMKQLNSSSAAKCSIESGRYAFHYLIEQGIVFLTLSEKSYPKRLVFRYLEEVYTGFVQELQSDYGDSWKNEVGTVARPYAYIKFDKFIQRKRKEFMDPNSRENMSKLNDEIVGVHNIMRKNIQEVLNRGEHLSDVSRMSSQLRDRSKDFKWGAKKLSLQAMYNKYGPVAAVTLFVLGLIYLRWFF